MLLAPTHIPAFEQLMANVHNKPHLAANREKVIEVYMSPTKNNGKTVHQYRIQKSAACLEVPTESMLTALTMQYISTGNLFLKTQVTSPTPGTVLSKVFLLKTNKMQDRQPDRLELDTTLWLIQH